MKYCPDCDMEFEDEVTRCTDCGRPLVDLEEYQAAQEKVEAEQKANREAQRAIDKERAAQARALKREMKEHPELAKAKQAEEQKAKPQRNGVYVKRADRYQDLRSSATAFLIVGAVMAVFTVLSFGKELHLPVALPVNIIMKLMFAVFAVGSFAIWYRTNAAAAVMKEQIGEEEQATKDLTEWFLKTYSAEQIDTAVRRLCGELRPELLAIQRMNFIQAAFVNSYELSDPSYVDALAEELYPKIFGADDPNAKSEEQLADEAAQRAREKAEYEEYEDEEDRSRSNAEDDEAENEGGDPGEKEADGDESSEDGSLAPKPDNDPGEESESWTELH